MLTQTWATGASAEARAVLEHVRLTESIDKGFYKVEYEYGDLVVKDGLFTMPGLGGGPNGCRSCEKLQRQLSKAGPVPLIVNLDRHLEVFRLFEDVHPKGKSYRTAPVAYRRRGEFLGVFETLRPLVEQQPGNVYTPTYGTFHVSAGTRNAHCVLPLRDRALVQELEGHAHLNLRDHYRSKDLAQYGISDTVSTGIASDWRFIRRYLDVRKVGPPWKASLLVLPGGLVDTATRTDSPLSMGTLRLQLALYREAFRQLQDALEAFTAVSPPVEQTSVFMNVNSASKGTAMAYLKAALAGDAPVHCFAVSEANGPWSALHQALCTDFYEVDDGYFPLILEPRVLDPDRPDAGFVSWAHPLIQAGLSFDSRTNERWVPGFLKRLGHVANLVGVYPEKKDRESVARLREPRARVVAGAEKSSQARPHGTADERLRNAFIAWPLLLGAAAFATAKTELKLFQSEGVLKEFLTVRTARSETGVLP